MELLRRLSLTIFLMSLIACGGGSLEGSDDNDGGDGGGEEPITMLVMAISDEKVSASSPATVTATVTQDDVAVSGLLVTFTLDNDMLASFTPQIGTAITDSDGVASITLSAGTTAGAGTVTGSITSPNAGELAAYIAFTSQGDGAGEVAAVADISLFGDSQQLSSSGSQEISLIAITKDINNNLMEGVTVVFTADSGQIEVTKAVTGSDGKAFATLKTDNAPTNRTITVDAASALVSDSFSVDVVGTSIALTGSSALAIGESNSFIVKVLNSDGVGIGNTLVNLSLSDTSTQTPAGGVAAITIPESVVTDTDGQATITVVGTSGGTNTILASTLGAQANRDVSVQTDSYLFTALDDGNGNIIVNPSTQSTAPEVLLSKTATITLTWTRASQSVADGTLVEFTTTRGSLNVANAQTVNGVVSVDVTSDDAGKALITFTGTDGDVVLNNQIEIEFVAETVGTIAAQASPASVGPDGQTSTISVVVKDENGNLVKNKMIDFTLTDTNGGTIFPASGQTDSNGATSTVYTSKGISAKDGVSITATVRENDTKKDTVTLTVSNRELFISLGTGNTIIQHNDTTYNKKYTVFVTDVDSNPVENVDVTVSAIPYQFSKGRWTKTYDEAGEFKAWVALHEDGFSSMITCPNEDLNLDGVLDSFDDGTSEDTNNNGMLTPGNVVAAAGEVTTDADGLAEIDILYAESYAHFVDVKLIFSARVNGTESAASTIFTLPVLSADVIKEDTTPATIGLGTNGPFGKTADCTTTD